MSKQSVNETPTPVSFIDDKNDDQLEQQQQLFATSFAIQRWIDKLNRQSPINIRMATLPICTASVKRIISIESFYARSRLFRFLLRKGLPPILLFLGTTTAFVWMLRRFYIRHQYLALHSLGVLYPAWKCWHLVKQLDTHGQPIEQLKECKSWLTYWMLYGSLQVLENWSSDLLLFFPNYNIYKLFILYWAQSPHSKGATILYQHVLQKPEDQDEEQQYQHNNYYESTFTRPSSSSSSSVEHHQQYKSYRSHSHQYQSLFNNNDEELTLTIGHVDDTEHEDNQQQDDRIRSFRIIDGYTPPTLASEEHPLSCESSISSSSGHESADYVSSQKDLEKTTDHHHRHQKQNYPILVPMETEAGW
ncbi:TB2/DP1, HVA22 family-domain-containing protein [Halteromyces radiatus]|uniref:TB2/DP1, HVA22 family-domain-containing protein n=1 Tax=Halteromyces radiatus TaxID=101107 RepID=UPI00222019B9|nr:TB2/DP1, HVA22 family-domain-containing protein [Halteromyces radiatus]KAI8089558.1 TB2/DP1, HVA22 family-domain-containing protein [Halteromyces radiatus]